jgi:hypothetical protein
MVGVFLKKINFIIAYKEEEKPLAFLHFQIPR